VPRAPGAARRNSGTARRLRRWGDRDRRRLEHPRRPSHGSGAPSRARGREHLRGPRRDGDTSSGSRTRRGGRVAYVDATVADGAARSEAGNGPLGDGRRPRAPPTPSSSSTPPPRTTPRSCARRRQATGGATLREPHLRGASRPASNSWAVSPDGRYAIAWTDGAPARRRRPRRRAFHEVTILDLAAPASAGGSTTLAVGYRPASFALRGRFEARPSAVTRGRRLDRRARPEKGPSRRRSALGAGTGRRTPPTRRDVSITGGRGASPSCGARAGPRRRHRRPRQRRAAARSLSARAVTDVDVSRDGRARGRRRGPRQRARSRSSRSAAARPPRRRVSCRASPCRARRSARSRSRRAGRPRSSTRMPSPPSASRSSTSPRRRPSPTP